MVTVDLIVRETRRWSTFQRPPLSQGCAPCGTAELILLLRAGSQGHSSASGVEVVRRLSLPARVCPHWSVDSICSLPLLCAPQVSTLAVHGCPRKS